MKNRTATAIYLILIFGLANCSGGFSASVATQTPKAIGQASPTLPAKSTNSPTEPAPTISPTQMSTAAASTLSPTTTATPDNGITKNCLTILPALPLPNEYQGKLILDKADKFYYYYDFQTAQTTKLPNHDLLNIAFSPDRKTYAYHERGSPYLQFFSSNGRLQRSIPWENDWYWMDGWLDSNRIIFEIPKITRNAGIGLREYPEPLLLLNLTTNQRQKLLPDYPRIDTGSDQTGWWSGTTIYDDSLTRVMYPGHDEGGNAAYFLWDVSNNKELAELPSVDFSLGPEWWPEGSKFFVYADDGEFYFVTRDGVISKVRTSRTFGFGTPAFSLSPDGRNVALWFGDLYSKLVVLDTQTGKMTDYCIQPEYGLLANNYPPSDPVWSPDRKAFAISGSTIAGQPEGDTILVDIENGIAAKIASGLSPIGWLAAP